MTNKEYYFRNNLVAHAGGVFDSGEVIVALNPIGPEFHVGLNLWRFVIEDDRENNIGFEGLIEHVKSNVEVTQKKILTRLLDREARDAVIQRKSSKRVRNCSATKGKIPDFE